MELIENDLRIFVIYHLIENDGNVGLRINFFERER